MDGLSRNERGEILIAVNPRLFRFNKYTHGNTPATLRHFALVMSEQGCINPSNSQINFSTANILRYLACQFEEA